MDALLFQFVKEPQFSLSGNWGSGILRAKYNNYKFDDWERPGRNHPETSA